MEDFESDQINVQKLRKVVMLGARRVVAIVPARGGSKRLPFKNILELKGMPLINWTIRAALNSKHVDEVVVSTDCPQIAKISKDCGANVPFMRPEHLASDTASTNDVILHMISELNCTNDDIIMILQPTSPLRTSSHISEALELLENEVASGVVSVCKCEHSPLWAGQLSEDGSFEGFMSEKLLGMRSQDLPVHFRLNGAIYAYSVDELVRRKGIYYDSSVFAYEMSLYCSVDIDTDIDFKLAEVIASDEKYGRDRAC